MVDANGMPKPEMSYCFPEDAGSGFHMFSYQIGE
jgi:hypothetical protein